MRAVATSVMVAPLVLPEPRILRGAPSPDPLRCGQCAAEAIHWTQAGCLYCARHWPPRVWTTRPMPLGWADEAVREHFPTAKVTPTETRLLGALLVFGPWVPWISNEQMQRFGWPGSGHWERSVVPYDGEDALGHLVRVNIARIHAKVRPGHTVENDSGVGYRLVARDGGCCPPAPRTTKERLRWRAGWEAPR